MKIKSTFLIAALSLSLTSFAQFFDSVPYRGAFGVHGGTRGTVAGYTGYDPDPTNTDADWTKPWAEFAPNTVAYPGDAGYNHSNSQFYTAGTAAEKVTLSSDISSDYHMTNDKWYEISGLIHVLNGVTLTIDAGTCIRGSLSNLGGLIIAQGGKIMAIADKNHPIVMTSQKAVGSRVRGDWAGLLILGLSSNNSPGGQRRFEALPADPLSLYGGGDHPNEADNSGSIRYMRVEFAGYNYLPDQEINGITFGAVGSGSHFDYMQSSFANDDGFEWFGGTSNHKYLISYAETDDEFDMDEGFHGNLQYLLGLRNAGVVETSPAGASNGLEHDNNTNLGTSSAVNPNIVAPTPTTAPTISNMTLVGPEHPGAFKSSLSTLWQQRGGEQMRIRTNAATGVFNSIAWGYATEINLPNVANLSPSVQTRAADDELCIRNTVVISAGAPDVKLNSSNFPTGGWAAGVTPWTSVADMSTWMVNGPTVSVYNYTGPTGNDISRTSITTTSDITHPDYSGLSNGALSQLDYTVCDFTLTGTSSAYYGTSSFQHPRIALVPHPGVSANPTYLPSFSQSIGSPSSSKWISVKTIALTASVMVTAPTGFEVSANGTSGWGASFTKGTTAADTLIYIRLNKATAGSVSGYIVISSTKATPEFNAINIAVNGTCIAPAAAYLNVSVSALNFTSPSVMSFDVNGKNLTADVTVAASANFQVSTNSVSGFTSTLTLTQSAGKLANTTVYVKYNGTGSVDAGNLMVTTTGADAFTVALTGNSAPSIITLPGLVQAAGASVLQYPVMNTIAGTPSVAYPIYISASQLTDTVKVGLIQSNSSALSNFQLSLDSAFTNPVTSLNLNVSRSATLNTTVYVRYNAATATTNAGFVTVTSAGAPLIYQNSSTVITGPAAQIVSISGRAVAVGGKTVSLYAPSYQLRYSAVLGTATAPQSIWVGGLNLGTDSVVVTAPANWEISTSAAGTYSPVLYFPNTGGTVNNTQVYVRYNPSVPFALNQFIIVTASSVTPTPNTNSATNLVELVFGVATPSVGSDLTSLPKFYTTAGKPSVAYSFKVNGFNLTHDSTVTVTSSNGFQVSLDGSNFSNKVSVSQSSTGVVSPTQVYVRYLSNTAGSASGSYVNVGTPGGASIPVLVSAVAVLPATPVVSLSTGALTPFSTNLSTPTEAQSFTVSAQNLQDSLSITVGSDFEVSLDSAMYTKSLKLGGDVDGNIPTTKLYARFNRATSGTSTDTIFFNSQDVATQKIVVTGTSTFGVGIATVADNITSVVMYPNPAQNELNIDFIINQKSDVTIQILDISGRIVKEIANANFGSGYNKVNANISDVNNGFYFVRIESLNGVKTSRLLIAK